MNLFIKLGIANTGGRKLPRRFVQPVIQWILKLLIREKNMDNDELRLLMEGIKFTPSSTVNCQELEEAIQKFCRKGPLVEFHIDIINENHDFMVNTKSKFNPTPNGRNTHLD